MGKIDIAYLRWSWQFVVEKVFLGAQSLPWRHNAQIAQVAVMLALQDE
jgi:hypothetical protein